MSRSLNDKVKRLGSSKRRAFDRPVDMVKFTILGKVTVGLPGRTNLGSYSKDKRAMVVVKRALPIDAYGPSVEIKPGKASGLQKDVGTCGKRNATRATRCYGNGDRSFANVTMVARSGWDRFGELLAEPWPLLAKV